MRKISKYELDRQEINFEKLKKEKTSDRTLNTMINKKTIEEELEGRYKEEVHYKDVKITQLSELKIKQDKERRDMVLSN